MISINAEGAFIKYNTCSNSTLNKQGMERSFLNLEKGMYEKNSQLIHTLMVYECFPCRSEVRKEYLPLPLLF
jgi:hypothetical protein